MGATSFSIMKIFIYQGLVAGLIGTFLGCIAGLAVALNLQKVSLFVEKVFNFQILPGDVYYLSELPSQVNYLDVVIIVVGDADLFFITSLRASRLDLRKH